MEIHNLLLGIGSIFLSGIFSGMEVAFLASDKLTIEIEHSKKGFVTKILKFLLKHPSHILASTLICTTIFTMVATSTLSEVINDLIISNTTNISSGGSDFLFLIINTIIITIIILIFAEFIPKSIFIVSPNKMLYFFAIPLYFVTIVFYPLVSCIIIISKFFIKKILKKNYTETGGEFELQDIHSFLKKNIDPNENSPTILRAKMAANVIDFKKIKIKDCMIPRTEIVAIEMSQSIDSIIKAFKKSEFTKILIYNKNIDKIIGYCNIKDILKSPKTIKEILKPILIFPNSTLANDVMLKFIAEKKNLGLVVDEFGGTAGMVTMEDIIEEIFGEIKDEHDNQELLEKKIDDKTYILSARLEINYLNEKFKWSIPQGNYETLGGYIIKILGKIPNVGEEIHTKKIKYIVLSKKKNKIKTLKLIIKS